MTKPARAHARQMERTPAQMHPLSTVPMPCKWQEHPLQCTRSELYPCQANGKNTRTSAPAQHCIHARQMVRTPARAPRSALCPCQANGKNARPRSALYPCQANGTNTRLSALAQHCIHARQMVRTPARAHLILCPNGMPGKW